jgi:hypothetical protein
MGSKNTDTGSLELGAKMDYAEHEKTFQLFVALTKYTTIISIVLVIALAVIFL